MAARGVRVMRHPDPRRGADRGRRGGPVVSEGWTPLRPERGLVVGPGEVVVAPKLGGVVTLQHPRHLLQELKQCRGGLVGELGGQDEDRAGLGVHGGAPSGADLIEGRLDVLAGDLLGVSERGGGERVMGKPIELAGPAVGGLEEGLGGGG